MNDRVAGGWVTTRGAPEPAWERLQLTPWFMIIRKDRAGLPWWLSAKRISLPMQEIQA